ncbi:hypothetical protein D3C85_1826530 [compost metagenome]
MLGDEVKFIRTFWMLMPIELKGIARMQATWNFLREMAQASKAVLMGESPG